MGQAHNPNHHSAPNRFWAVLIAIGLVMMAGLTLVYWDERKGTAHLEETPPAPVQSAIPDAGLTDAGLPDASLAETSLPEAAPTRAAPRPLTDKSVPLVERSPPAKASAPLGASLVIRRILPIKSPIRYGDWMWDEKGVPDESLKGTLIITVDLEARVLSVFRDGYEIGAAAVLLGTQEKPTPLGIFPITQKDATHVSNLYNAPMPYMLRLTNDGVSIHGSNVRNGYASHGCIGVPKAFAQKLFARAKLGDKVIITRGKQTGLGEKL